MKSNFGWVLLGICAIICASIIGNAYKHKYQAQKRIVVTGLGEQEFTSDRIVWRGWIIQPSSTMTDGYAQLEASKNKVKAYIASQGIPDSCVVFQFVNVYKTSEPIYNNGQYVGQRNTGYELRQEFTVESDNVDAVEQTSRDISSLIAQGIQLESNQPDYYYSKLESLKLQLIEKATADARMRALKIAKEAKAKIKTLASARMGVFQITGANTNEEYLAGGSFNTSSRNKKASITMRLEYNIK